MRFIDPGQTTPLPFIVVGEDGSRDLRSLKVIAGQGVGRPILVPDIADSEQASGVDILRCFEEGDEIERDYLEAAVAELGLVPEASAEILQVSPHPDAYLAGRWKSHLFALARTSLRHADAARHLELARRLEDPYYVRQFDWAMLHGSDRLKAALRSGHRANGLYRRERATQFLPGAYIDHDGMQVRTRTRPNPSEAALHVLQAMAAHASEWDGAEYDIAICWVLELPEDLAALYTRHGADIFEGGFEAVVLRGWLGRHDLYIFLPDDRLTIDMPHVADPTRPNWLDMAPALDNVRAGERYYGSAWSISTEAAPYLAQSAAAVYRAVFDLEVVVTVATNDDEPFDLEEQVLESLGPIAPYFPDLDDVEDAIEFVQGLTLCAAVVGTKLASAPPQPMACPGEDFILGLIGALAGAAMELSGVGSALDITLTLPTVHNFEALVDADTSVDPAFAYDRWFVPYSPTVGGVHPLLSGITETVEALTRDDDADGLPIEEDPDAAARRFYLRCRRGATSTIGARRNQVRFDVEAFAHDFAGLCDAFYRVGRRFGDHVRIYDGPGDGLPTLDVEVLAH